MTYVSPNSTNSRIGKPVLYMAGGRPVNYTETATDFLTISTSQKAMILSELSKIDHDSITGYSIKLFVRDAHLKTDEQVMQCVLDLQSQIRDNVELMQSILKRQFDFIRMMKFNKK